MADTIPGSTGTTSIALLNGSVSSGIDFAGDTDWFSATLQVGWGYQIWLEGSGAGAGTLVDPFLGIYSSVGAFLAGNDDSSGRDSFLYFTPSSTGTYFFSAEEFGNDATGTYRLRIETDVLASTASAATATPDGWVIGAVGSGSDFADWSPITLVAGTQYEIDLVGSAADGAGVLTLADPWLALRNSAGTILVSDDNSGVGDNSRIFYTPTVTGTYYIDAEESGVNASGSYRQIVNSSPTVGTLSIGGSLGNSLDFFGDIDLFRVTLAAGNTYNFTVTGGTLADPFLEVLDSAGAVLTYNDDASGLNSYVSFTALTSGTYFLGVRESGNNATGTFTVSAALGDTVAGGTSTTASVSASGLAFYNGAIDFTGDRDWVAVTLAAGMGYQFWLQGSSSGSGTLADPLLSLYNAAGTLIASDDDSSTGLDSFLYYAATAAGTYYLGAADVGDDSTGTYTITVESDALDSTASSSTLAPDSWVSGRLGFGSDISDWVRITLVAGTNYQFDAVGSAEDGAGAQTLADPYLVLRNSSGVALFSDDDSGVGLNARLFYTPTTTGTYYLDAQESGNNASGTYRLVVNASPVVAALAIGGSLANSLDFTGDTDLFMVSLTAGSTYNFTVTGGTLLDPFLEVMNSAGAVQASNDDTNGLNSFVSFTAPTTGSYYLGVRESGNNATGTFTVSATFTDSIPASTATTATVSSGGVNTASGTIDFAGDRDWYSVALSAGIGYQFWLEGVSGGVGTLGDPVLSLYDPAGTLIASDNDAGVGLDSFLAYAATASGTYYLGAGEMGDDGTGTYRLTVERDALASTASTFTMAPDSWVSSWMGFGSDTSDWVRITLVAGTNYEFDLMGSDDDGAGAQTLADPYMVLRNSAGTAIVSDDNSGVGNNARIFYTPSTTGTYFIDAQESGNNASGTYRLVVNSNPVAATLAIGGSLNNSLDFTGDTDLFMVSLTAGSTYNFTVTGGTLLDPFLEVMNASGVVLAYNDNTNGLNSFVSFTSPSSGSYFLGVRESGSNATGTFTVSAAFGDSIPASTATTATLPTSGSNSTNSSIDFIGDRDWFAVTLSAGVGYQVWLEGAGSGLGTLGDPSLSLYNAAGTVVASNDDSLISFTSDSFLYYVPTTSGTYYIGAAEFGDDATGTYRVTIESDSVASTATTTVQLPDSWTAGRMGFGADTSDWFRITLAAGTTYQFDVLGSAEDGAAALTMADPYLVLRNASGVALFSDDDSGVGLNARLFYTPTTTGTYYLDVQESGNNASGTYRLVVNSSPVVGTLAIGGSLTNSLDFTGDTDLFLVSLAAGSTYSFSVTGGTLLDPFLEVMNSAGVVQAWNDDSSGLDASVRFTAATTGNYYLGVRESGGDATGTYTVSAVSTDAIPASTSTTVSIPATGSESYDSTIDFAGDRDWFAVSLVAGRGYQVWLQGAASGLGTLADPVLSIYNSAGTLLASNDDSFGSRDSYLYFAPDTTGTYYLGAADLGDNDTGSYRVTVESDALASTASQSNLVLNSVSLLNRIGAGTDVSDWYRVTLTAGTTYLFDVVGSADDGAATGLTLADPWLGLRDSAGALITSDDDSGVGTNARIFYTPTTTGTYFLEVQESGQNAAGTYRVVVNTAPVSGSISIGATISDFVDFAGDTDLFSVTLVAGTSYGFAAAGTTLDPYLELLNFAGQVVASNDNASGLTAALGYTPSASGTYYLAARASGNDETGSYSLAAVMSDTIAGGTSTTQSFAGSSFETFSSAIDFNGDADWFSVPLLAGWGYQVWLEGADSGHGTLGDPLLSFYNASGTLLSSNDNHTLRDSFLYLQPATSGTYYLGASESGNNATGTYTISFERDALASTATAASIAPNSSISGRMGFGDDDADWYRISLVAGTTYQFDSVGSAEDGSGLQTLADPWLALRDANGVLLASNDDGGVGLNARVTYTPTVSGTYYLDTERYGTYSTGSYLLVANAAPTTNPGVPAGPLPLGGHLAGTIDFAGDIDLYEYSLLAGSSVDITVTGGTLADPFLEVLDANRYVVATNDNGTTGLNSFLNFTASTTGTYFFAVRESGNNATGTYDLATVLTTRGDRFENNDTATAATALGTISGTRTESTLSIEANDPDWYRFSLASPGRTGDNVTVNFTHTQGDVDMELYDGTGSSVLQRSTGVGNQEQVSLAGLAAGSYLVRVYGYAGASNPNYSLSITATPGTAADRLEENDTVATATNLGAISGTRTETALTVQSNDDDWYRFTLPGTGRAGDQVLLNFTHALGDVDMSLYDSTGTTVLSGSYGTSNQEQISLAGMAAGNYYLRVYGFSGANNPNYSLTVSAAPQTVGADRFEDNDSASAATVLGTVSGTVTESSLTVQSGDADWYRFTLAGPGRSGDAVSIAFRHSLGDIDMELYDTTGANLLGWSYGVTNSEQISLDGRAAGSYLVRVYGFNSASNPDYAITVSATPQTVAADRFEDNDTPATATDLRTISGSVVEANLTVQSNDADWYRFTLAAPGRTGDGALLNYTLAQGDVDMQLYNGAGTALLASSVGPSNQEYLSFAGLAAGTYLLLVYGAGSASNPNYSLGLAATPPASGADRFEDNDTAATATDLRTVSGTLSEANLSIQAGDDDWYAFTLASAGRAGDAVRVNFTHSQGDIDMVLYAANGTTVLGRSAGVGNQEQISLDGMAAGHYLLRVYGYNNAANPDYSLGITVSQAAALAPDQWEVNNTSAQATVIRSASQTLSGATITAGDQDWYTFTLAQAGAASDRVALHTSGTGLQVQVLDAQQNVVAQATSDSTGLASAALGGRAAGQYFVKVAGETGATQAQYDLEVRAEGVAPAVSAGWTVLVYVNGDNELEPDAIGDLNEMEAALNRAGVNVGVQVDRSPGYDTSNGNWTDTRRGVIVHDSNTSIVSSTLTSIGEVDMGAGASLTSFINWGVQNLPAQRYMLVIWDHGGGALSGSSFDYSSQHDSLTNAELARAVAASTVGHVDILGFDACLMAGIEVAAQLDQVASVMVASELTEPGDGWDYTAILDYLQSTSTPVGLASRIVDSYGAFYGPGQTLSATALSGVAAIESAIDAFATLMRTATNADWTAVNTARARAVTGDSGATEYVDIVSFMRALMTASSNPAVDAAAQAVITAVDAAVLRKAGQAAYDGLTVVFPIRGTPLDATYTAANHDFVGDTAWREFLQLYLGRSTRAGLAGTDPSAPDFAERLDLSGHAGGLPNDTIDTPFQIGLVNQADYQVLGLSIDSATDADWFTFTMPAGTGYLPKATVTVADGVAGVHVELRDVEGNLLAQATSTADNGKLVFDQVAAGGTYKIGVTAPQLAGAAGYELHLDAFGSATAVALPDFGEAAGGNNEMAKAWSVGTASELAGYGALSNLSLDANDLAGGAAGGDWFRVDSVRVTEANVDSVEVLDVNGSSSAITIKVFDLAGNLVAQSSQPGDLAVTFDPQVDDIYVQVQAAQSTPILGYSLLLRNLPPDSTAPTVTGIRLGATGAQNGRLNAGDVVTATVAMSEATIVNGTPRVALDIGGTVVQADYVSGSGTDSLVFSYTVLAGQTDADGISVAANSIGLNGGTLADAAQNAAMLAHAAVADDPTLKVDTTAPATTGFAPADEAVSVPLAANVVVTFAEAIQRGTGTIVLQVAGGAAIETFDAAASPRISISGNTLTLDPSADLAEGISYQVVFAPGSVTDLAGNAYAGTTSYNFTSYANSHPTGTVSISGNAVKGATLTASNSLVDVDGLGPITYEWKAGNTVVGTGTTYVLKNEDVGKAVTVTARYTDLAGHAESVASASTPPVSSLVEGVAYNWKTHVLMDGVGVTSLDPAATQTTTADGHFQFALPAGSHGFSATRSSDDSGGAITSADALAALRLAVGINPNPDPDGAGPQSALRVSPYQFIAADVNKDGKVNSADALAILRMAVKAAGAPPQEWLFVDERQDLWNETAGASSIGRDTVAWNSALQADGQRGTPINLVAILKGDVNGSWVPAASSQNLDTANPGYLVSLATQLNQATDVWGF